MNRNAIAAVALSALACGGASDPPQQVAAPSADACLTFQNPSDVARADAFDQKPLVATAAGAGYTVEVRADAPLQYGLNGVSVRVADGAGAAVTDAAVAFRPSVATAGGSQPCAVVGAGAASADGTYRLRAVLVASGSGRSWSAEVTIARGGAAPARVAIPAIAVVAGKNLARTFDHAGTRYLMALEFRQALRVGLDPVVVTLHATQDGGATFAPVNDAALALDPQMPSMGHGSPGSVNPVRTGDGWYEGQVSFSMTGDWQVTIAATRSGEAIGSPAFVVWF